MENRSEESLFLSLLAILFIALKLTNHIDWSWWWVLAPLWVPAAVIGFFLLCLFIWAMWGDNITSALQKLWKKF